MTTEDEETPLYDLDWNGIDLDGSVLEGGGQLVRNAVALSVIQRIPVRIRNIRENREDGGLQIQHVAELRLAQEISHARARGIAHGSRDVAFYPSQTRISSFTANALAAGSTSLLLQIALPCLLFAESPELGQEEHESTEMSPSDSFFADVEHGPGDSGDTYSLSSGTQGPASSTLSLFGGTNADQAPHADYTSNVLLPLLNTHVLPHQDPARQLEPPSPSQPPESEIEALISRTQTSGRSLTLDIIQRGFYPAGGGHISAQVPALRKGEYLRPLELLERGTVRAIEGITYVRLLPSRIASLMRDGAISVFQASAMSTDSAVDVRIEVKEEQEAQAGAPGSFISLHARTSTAAVFGASVSGRWGMQAEQTGEAAARELLGALNYNTGSPVLNEPACVDGWTQDQLVIFMALANGWSSIRIGGAGLSLRTRTAMWIAETLIGCLFEIVDESDGEGRNIILKCFSVGIEGRLDFAQNPSTEDRPRSGESSRNVAPFISQQ